MKVAVYTENKNMSMAKIKPPDLKGREGAIIKVNGCGLCGSDIVKIKKNLVPAGTVLGHEVVGVIKEIKTSFDTELKANDRIAVAHHVPCFNCRYCDQKSYSMCKIFKQTNLEPGGFAEYIYLSPLHIKFNSIKVPDNVNDQQASLMEPLGCVLRALDRIKIHPGQNILVVGLGFIGLLFIQALKEYDCFIMGCDLIEERIKIAAEIGANKTFKSVAINDSIDLITNTIGFKGVDTVILASGSNNSIDFALKTVRDGGQILVFASIPDEAIGYINNQIYYRELSVIGAYSAAPEFLASAMKLISYDKIKMDDYCITLNVEEINQAVQKTINHETMKVFLKL